jgi:mannonate dehydratase
MSCAAPWHAGMAYALGYLRAALQTIVNECSENREKTPKSEA